MLPVSISCFRKKVVTPVSFSPLIIAQLIGPAPLYCGNKEPCRLNVPKEGMGSANSSVAATGSDSTTNDYKRELAKLLSKSKGTPYEYMLRKFVENKLKDMTTDQEEQARRLEHFHSPEKVQLATLSTSKYDSPLYVARRAEAGQSLRASFSPQINKISSSSAAAAAATSSSSRGPVGHLFLDNEVSANRIEEMAMPLDRNRYKVGKLTLALYFCLYICVFHLSGARYYSSINQSHWSATTSPEAALCFTIAHTW